MSQTGITNTQFRRAGTKGNVLGYATITFNAGQGELVLRDFSIVKSKDGDTFVSWPSKKLENPKPGGKQYLNTVFYTSEDYRDLVNTEILDSWYAFDKTAPKTSYNKPSYGGSATNKTSTNKTKTYTSTLDDTTF